MKRSNMKRALYTGSFDPMTNGHLDIIERSSKIFDSLTIGVIVNPRKNPLFTVEERMDMIKKSVSHLDNIKVTWFQGLLADFVNSGNFDAVIRGLRATTDFDYEIQMAQMNARLFNSGIESVFLMTNPDYSFISSSLIKEVVSLGGDVKGLVPENILLEIKKKYIK